MGSPHSQATGRQASSVPVMTVDLAALFAELAESQTQHVEGYSVEEIAAKVQKNPATIRRLIRQALDNGSCEVVPRRIKTITGCWTTKAAYRFKGVTE